MVINFLIILCILMYNKYTRKKILKITKPFFFFRFLNILIIIKWRTVFEIDKIRITKIDRSIIEISKLQKLLLLFLLRHLEYLNNHKMTNSIRN